MNPSARSASATQSAAPSHSLLGNTAGSATDWNATSSASSSRARGISEATVSGIGRAVMGTLLVGATLWVGRGVYATVCEAVCATTHVRRNHGRSSHRRGRPAARRRMP
ncbi:hypothetical protein SBADM41S_06582 [Streptomyces badius]